MGNFNGYLPTLMERYTEEEVKSQRLEGGLEQYLGSYFFKTQVLKGFIYRFYFSVGDQEDFVLDNTQPKAVNPFGKETNVIEVPLVDPSQQQEETKDVEEDSSFAPPDIAKMPSYSSLDMPKVLPKQILDA